MFFANATTFFNLFSSKLFWPLVWFKNCVRFRTTPKTEATTNACNTYLQLVWRNRHQINNTTKWCWRMHAKTWKLCPNVDGKRIKKLLVSVYEHRKQSKRTLHRWQVLYLWQVIHIYTYSTFYYSPVCSFFLLSSLNFPFLMFSPFHVDKIFFHFLFLWNFYKCMLLIITVGYPATLLPISYDHYRSKLHKKIHKLSLNGGKK